MGRVNHQNQHSNGNGNGYGHGAWQNNNGHGNGGWQNNNGWKNNGGNAAHNNDYFVDFQDPYINEILYGNGDTESLGSFTPVQTDTFSPGFSSNFPISASSSPQSPADSKNAFSQDFSNWPPASASVFSLTDLEGSNKFFPIFVMFMALKGKRHKTDQEEENNQATATSSTQNADAQQTQLKDNQSTTDNTGSTATSQPVLNSPPVNQAMGHHYRYLGNQSVPGIGRAMTNMWEALKKFGEAADRNQDGKLTRAEIMAEKNPNKYRIQGNMTAVINQMLDQLDENDYIESISNANNTILWQ